MVNETTTAPKKGRTGVIVWILLATFAIGAGASAPWILGSQLGDVLKPKKVETPKSKHAAILFGDVVVNIGDERQSRHLRVKLMVAVEDTDLNEATELVTKQKAFLKSWLIGYLSDQSHQDVTRKVGVNRIRREIRDQFNAMLYPNGEEKIVDILFDEFVVP